MALPKGLIVFAFCMLMLSTTMIMTTTAEEPTEIADTDSSTFGQDDSSTFGTNVKGAGSKRLFK
ncbi:hypothetical protein JCGZ_05542 [Jatropha curcas]|uniref:Uncharacterized protein n=1 Tax=Jatropha curcas TaxID=180498 RepID=A0A067LHK0_JATCU|nr:hypothetical protein JCGZ_05542 [Jatropha curcas]